MKEFKSFLKLPGGGEIKRCYYPFKLDTYGCGCCNNCLYCYAKSCLYFRKLWDSKEPSSADYIRIEKLFTDIFDRKKKSKYSIYFEKRIPLRLGGMTDCFSKIENTQGNTYKVLKLLNKYNYPYLILTKNTLVANDKYVDVLSKDLTYIQFSITTPYDEIAEVYEEGAETTSERLKAIKKLSQSGFYVAARINPLFPIYSDGHFSGKDKQYLFTEQKLKYFDWSLIDMIADAGVKTVIAGFLRLSSWNIKWIKEKTGEDLTWLFDTRVKRSNQAFHFSTEEKRYYYEKIKNICDKRNMAFTVCYDGDEDYETFRYLWANKNDCCNGKGKIKEFKNAFDFVNTEFIK